MSEPVYCIDFEVAAGVEKFESSGGGEEDDVAEAAVAVDYGCEFAAKKVDGKEVVSYKTEFVNGSTLTEYFNYYKIGQNNWA